MECDAFIDNVGHRTTVCRNADDETGQLTNDVSNGSNFMKRLPPPHIFEPLVATELARRETQRNPTSRSRSNTYQEKVRSWSSKYQPYPVVVLNVLSFCLCRFLSRATWSTGVSGETLLVLFLILFHI